MQQQALPMGPGLHWLSGLSFLSSVEMKRAGECNVVYKTRRWDLSTDMMQYYCDTILVHFILAMNLKMFRWSYERDFSCILLFFAVRFAGPNFVYVGQGDES